MPSPRRTYSPDELNQLLNAIRVPLLSHHPAVRLLLSMVLVVDNIFALDIPEDDDTEWLTLTAEVFQREILRGTAELLTYGVERETVN